MGIDPFDPKMNRGVLPKDYQRCVVCGLTRKVSDLTEAWQAGDGSDPVLVGLSCVDGCEPAHREAEAAKKDEILSRAEKAEARVVELEAMLRDPEAVRANLLRGTIANPPGLAWLGDSDGPVAELRQRAEKAEARVAALEAHIRKGDEFIGAVERAEKAERERDVARAEAAMLREALEALLPGKKGVSKQGVDWGSACGRLYLSVAGWSVAMEGDISRDEKTPRCWDAASIKAVVEHFYAPIRAALAASPGDWLAARDRALAERVREAVLGKPMDLPKDNAAWCTSCLENVQTAVEVRANAIDLDALVGGKS